MKMNSFQWKNDFSVGIKEMDDQYKDFLTSLTGCRRGKEISI
jgi:hemerythrin